MKDVLVKVENLQPESFCEAISFEVLNGEAVCLFGMNGSGKTLIIKTLCDILKPFGGKCEVLVPKNEIGICLQFPEHLVFCDTALKEACLITNNEEKAKKLLDEIAVSYDQPPFFMSDGQKRLLFVYGLLETKKLLIFDEPFASLDNETKKEVSDRIIKGAMEGKGIIYTANRLIDTKIAHKIINISRQGELISLKI